MKSYQIYDKIEAMEQTGENQSEKYDRSELPSCFMTPETPGNELFGRTTPSIEAFPSYNASCFLTPPCSQEKVFRPPLHAIDLQGLPKLDLELEDGDREKSVRKDIYRSPLLPEDRIIGRLIGEEKVDFISDLKTINCQKICQKICSYLEPQDLCRFASVCSKWRNFIEQDTQIGERWRGFLAECKQHFTLKGKENRGISSTFKLAYPEDLTRLPLKSINLNKLHEWRKDKTDDTASRGTELQIYSHPISRQTSNELRPCPKCTSPSNLSKMTEGHCQCQKCGLSFCSVCLRDVKRHTGSDQCEGLSVTPATRTGRRLRSQKTNKDVVGSKQSKERVRRL